jgi:mRNA-degrading endonuclease RelE of RelBE toxin-antitoxin system
MPTGNYSVSVSPAAYDKMFDHMRFLARVSVPASERLYLSLEEAIKELKRNPKRCPIYTLPGKSNAELRYRLFGKRYRIVFEIIDNAVYVYDIQDCRQDTDKNLV